MAENSILPGTDIEIIQKYPESGGDPKSLRLDFPDFEEVCQTTFAKGTIINDPKCFKVTEDDPITVESMVRVKGDFGESDYIPIFYHPKEFYWDDPFGDPPVKATDFDEETGAFKRAWMSFRSGDEVVVMLKEKVPVAVMGHADGVPRIGEDIIQVNIGDKDPFYVSISRAQKSTIDEHWLVSNPGGLDSNPAVGPDGMGLKTVQKAELASNVEMVNHTQYDRWWGSDEYSNPSYPNRKYWKKITSNHSCKLSVFPVVVGPILYAIYISSIKGLSKKQWYWTDITAPGSGDGHSHLLGPYFSPSPHVSSLDAYYQNTVAGEWGVVEWDKWWNYWIVNIGKYGSPLSAPSFVATQAGGDGPNGVGYFESEDPYFQGFYLEVKAALYSKELYDNVLSSIAGSGSPIEACGITIEEGTLIYTGPDYSLGETICPTAPNELKTQLGLSYFMGDIYRSDSYFDSSDFACPEAYKWLTRPHTKAEMEAAGM